MTLLFQVKKILGSPQSWKQEHLKAFSRVSLLFLYSHQCHHPGIHVITSVLLQFIVCCTSLSSSQNFYKINMFIYKDQELVNLIYNKYTAA